ncbi:hypothetical protein [Actinomycetospora aeridis]|uniref:Uncharacterized protein n=1 Tax=Actinomycetospora aeridis TaxID=3129231 RepID=A0ABU8N8F6_9PSEU
MPPHRLGRRAFVLGVAGSVAAACAAGRAAPVVTPGAADTDWTRLPPGPIPATDAQGRRYLQTRVPAATRPPVVGAPGPGLNAGLPDGRSATYVVQDLAAPVSELGAVFAFGPGNELGSLCLARFDRWDEQHGSRGDVRSTCHLGITPTRWTYGVLRTPRLEVVRTQEFRTPIAQDGSPHTMRVAVAGSTATIVEPDGTEIRIEDPRVAVAGPETFACWEFFKLGPGAGDVTFLRTWAS